MTSQVCTTGLLSGAELLSRGKTRTQLEHQVQSLKKEKDMLLERVCKASSKTEATAGTPSEISTLQDLVNSIVSIVESSDDIEGTSADTGKELFSIGEDTKALEMARDKLLAEMSALKESNKCPGKNANSVDLDPSATIPADTANSVDLDPSATIPIDTANGGDLNPSATIHIVTADKIEILNPSAILHPADDNSGDLDPEKVTCHDSVDTTGRNSFWNQPPLTSPFVFDIKTEGRIYIRLSAENNGLPDMYRINSYPWGPKIYRRTKGKWIAKVHEQRKPVSKATKLLWVLLAMTSHVTRHAEGQPERACDSSGRSAACTCESDFGSVFGCGRDLTELPSWVPTDTLYFDVTGSKLTSLPRAAFQQLSKLKVLTLSRNEISEIQLGAFDGLDGSLTELRLDRNKLSNLEVGTFEDLPLVESLMLNDNMLADLRAGVFRGLISMVRLDLNGNRITSLPVGVFSDLPALRSIYLARNGIKNVNNILPSLPTFVSRLDLEGNNIRLDRGVFVRFENLTTLNLNENGFGNLEAGVFNGLVALSRLYLNDNNITSLVQGLFLGLEKLTLLSVENNQLVQLSGNSFGDHPSFNVISFENNNISMIEADFFSRFPTLGSVNLESNNLSFLPPGIFDSLVELEFLILEKNRLEILDPNLFQDLHNAWSIQLGYNNIKTLPDGIFRATTRMHFLHLNDNALSSLPKDIFSPLSQLTGLALENNQLTVIEDSTFKLPTLESIQLNGNALANISCNMFPTTNMSLYAIDIDCTCEWIPVYDCPEFEFLGSRVTCIKPRKLWYDKLGEISKDVLTCGAPNTAWFGRTEETTPHRGACAGESTQRYHDRSRFHTTIGLTMQGQKGTISGCYSLVKLLWVLLAMTSHVTRHAEGRPERACDSSGRSAACTCYDDTVSCTRGADLAELPSGIPTDTTNLDLTGNKLTSLPKMAFQQLSRLNLNGNRITSLPVGVFSDLPALRSIYLARNGIRTLDNVLPSLPTLVSRLDLEGNNISRLDRDVFARFENLTALNLNENGFGNLEAGVFNGLVALSRLYLNDNNITSLAQGLFLGLEKLRRLSVDNNQLVQLNGNVFGDHPSFNVISFENNNISMIETDFFSRFPTLGSVNLESNNLSFLPPGIFNNLAELEFLRLEKNRLESLDANLFQDLRNAWSIQLGYNNIKTLPDGIFRATTRLHFLHLNDNALSSLPKDIFSPLSKLMGLELENNQLTVIEDSTFNLPTLESIQLNGNPLVNISCKMFPTTNMSLYAIDVDCTCEWIPVYDCPEFEFLGSRVTCIKPRKLWYDKLDEISKDVLTCGAPSTAWFGRTGWFGLASAVMLGLRAFTMSFLKAVGTICALLLMTHLMPVHGEPVVACRGPGESLACKCLDQYVSCDYDDLTEENDIKSLPSTIFYGLRNLKVLYLHTNELTVIENGTFSDLPKLEDIYLEKNPLVNITCDVLPSQNGPSVFTKFFKAVRRICALLLMTHLVIPVQGEPVVACGSVGESLACTCRFRYVSCRLGDLTEVPTGMRDDVITLELWGNKITSIPKTAFVNLTRLYSIDLSRNKISSVEVGAFDWQADSLYQLSLNNNELETLPVGVFRNLSKFSFLDLDDNLISSLSVGLFRGLPELLSISLNGNRIASLPVGIFADLPSLSEVKLARNKIKNIVNILPALPSELSSLDLKGNGLGNLRAAVFSGMPKLESLELEANEMDSLPKNLFLGLDKLSVLRLDHNMFVELNRSSFGSHPLLKRLSFANNSIVRIEQGFFSTYPKLREINLSTNDLSFLPPGTFDNLTSLRYLHLEGNKLDNLNANIFRDLEDLRYLYLQENGIKNLPSTIFYGLRNLIILYLDSNELSVIENGTFSNLPKIEYIFLEKNPLVNITCDVLPSQNVSKKLWGIGVDCTCEWKPVYDCPEFSWFDSIGTCVRPIRLIGDSLDEVPKDALTCVATRMVGLNPIGMVVFCLISFDFFKSSAPPSTKFTIKGSRYHQGPTAGFILVHFQERQVLGPSVFTKFFKAVRRICALLLMTHLVIPVQGEPVVACGSAGESLACTCRFRYVSCRLGDLTEVPTGMRDDTITLELWGNKITSIPKTAFVNLTRLYSIDLSRNKISSVEVGAFDWQADSLYQLSLNNNELETLSVGVFRNLSKFSFLDLDDNSISSLSVGLFRGLPKLVSISLNGNRISSLPVGIFADLPLSELKLARNKIKNIDNILPALPSELSSLDLKGNGLGNLRAAVFSELPKLESLKLEANEMDSLPKNLFLGLDKLSVLRLDHNMFVELNRSSFGSHPLLKRLSFANNSIVRIEQGFFSTYPKLREINLSTNDLSFLPPGTFDNLTSLRYLHLEGNKLDNLNANIFRDLEDLRYLYLQENGIKNLPSTIFYGLRNLIILYLDSNDLTLIENGTFSDLPKIEYIFLEMNPLVNITCGVLPSQNVSKKLWEIGVDCTCEWKPVYDCPEFSWFDSIVTCVRPIRLIGDSLDEVPKDALTCDATRMVGLSPIGMVVFCLTSLYVTLNG
uniref:LRRNT domain-containing protein n=1 Tax=Branchiostoma floridae TaxID=7739 RepID=C3YSM8_BRAFL|eukprot:XP_002600717.1 hypothetical protein BRAFLDRAFT_83459 [Branchiostoma floridae]